MSVESRPEKYTRFLLGLALAFSAQACKAHPDYEPTKNPPPPTPEFTPTLPNSEINLITPPTPTEQVIFTSPKAQKEYPTPVVILTPTPIATPTPVPTFTPTPLPPTPTKEAIVAEIPLSLWEEKIYQAVNELRSERNLGTLKLSNPLIEAARERSLDMATRNYFSHTNPERLMIFDLLEQRGITCVRKNHPGEFDCGEILFMTNGDKSQIDKVIEEIINKFLNSPDHRSILLTNSYQFIGVGVATSEDNLSYGSIVFSFPLQ